MPGRLGQSFLALFFVALVFLPLFSESQASTRSPQLVKKDPQALSSLVRQYLTASTSESAESVLPQILNHPQATVASVAEIIQQPRSYGQQPVGSQPSQDITVHSRLYRYSLYVPPSYDSTNAYPLIVCLHGAGFTGGTYIDRWVPRLNDRYILVCPTISMGAWWRRSAEELILSIMRTIQERYHVDANRVFLTGMSNGGIGTWIIGMHHADLYAGIAPMASGIDDVLFPFVENLQQTAVYVIHGVHDQVMPVSLSRSLVNEMINQGIEHVYREHNFTHPHAGGHFFPREELPALVSWFDQQKRRSISRKVSVVRDATHLSRFSWIRIDATDPIAAFSENLIDKRDDLIAEKVYAAFKADMPSSNHIVVTTRHVQRYSLFLNEELVDFSRPVRVETNGNVSFEGMVSLSLEVLLHEARHRQDSARLFPAKITIDTAGN